MTSAEGVSAAGEALGKVKSCAMLKEGREVDGMMCAVCKSTLTLTLTYMGYILVSDHVVVYKYLGKS